MNPASLAKPGNEDSHQIAFMCHVAKRMREVPELKWLHHVPNGEQRGDGTAKGAAIAGGRLKAMGVRKGICDISWPCPRKGFHGLYIEMKHDASGLSDIAKAKMVSPEQKEFLTYLQEQGYACGVAYGWVEAVAALEWYLTED